MSARVHPSFLPHLRHARRAPFRWYVDIPASLRCPSCVPKATPALLRCNACQIYLLTIFDSRFKPVFAVSMTGIALKLYMDRTIERRDIDMLATDRDSAEQQRRNNELLDMYGDRSSLEELEKAIQYYEKK